MGEDGGKPDSNEARRMLDICVRVPGCERLGDRDARRFGDFPFHGFSRSGAADSRRFGFGGLGYFNERL